MLGGSPSPKVSLQVRCCNPGTGVPAGGYLRRELKIPTAGGAGQAQTEGLAGRGPGVGLQGSPRARKNVQFPLVSRMMSVSGMT